MWGGGTLSGGQVIAAPPWGGAGPTLLSRRARHTLNLTPMGGGASTPPFPEECPSSEKAALEKSSCLIPVL